MNFLSRFIPCLALATAAFLAPVNAEPEHPAKPLLWKVEGPGVERASYLFGTFHLGTKSVATLHPAAEKAFGEAGVVHTEAAYDVKSQMESMKVMARDDGKMLDAAIGEKLSKRLDAELKSINPAIDATPLQPMKTWLVAYTLPFLPEQIKGIKPLDLVLWERAEKEGKKTAGMQEVKDQMMGFNQLTEEEQLAFLGASLDMLENDRRAGRDRMEEAAAAYVTGDAAKIYAFSVDWMAALAGGKDTPVAKKMLGSLLKARDVIMADYIATTLKKDPANVHFFAAGAGHYAGTDSVPSLLQKKGYKVTRVEE